MKSGKLFIIQFHKWGWRLTLTHAYVRKAMSVYERETLAFELEIDFCITFFNYAFTGFVRKKAHDLPSIYIRIYVHFN